MSKLFIRSVQACAAGDDRRRTGGDHRHRAAPRGVAAGRADRGHRVLGATCATEFADGMLSGNLNASYGRGVVQFEIPNPLLDQEAVTLLNASLMWTSPSGRWILGLHGKNLTDEAVKTAGYCFGFASTGCPSSLGLENNVSVFYGPPREFSGTIEYRF